VLDSLGNIGDFVGGVGVVVTLVYLALQIRQNTRSTKTSSYHSAVSAVSEWSRGVGMDPDATRIIRDGNVDYESLSPLDKARYGFLTVSLFRHFENIFYQHEQGAIDDSLWSAWSDRMRSVVAQPGVEAWWRENQYGYTEEFRNFLETA